MSEGSPNDPDSDSLCTAESYCVDDEVFFGRITEKELKLARRLAHRRTEFYYPDFRANRPSMLMYRASDQSPQDEGDVSDANSTAKSPEIIFDSMAVLSPSENDAKTASISLENLKLDDENDQPSSTSESSFQNLNDSYEIHQMRSSTSYFTAHSHISPPDSEIYDFLRQNEENQSPIGSLANEFVNTENQPAEDYENVIECGSDSHSSLARPVDDVVDCESNQLIEDEEMLVEDTPPIASEMVQVCAEDEEELPEVAMKLDFDGEDLRSSSSEDPRPEVNESATSDAVFCDPVVDETMDQLVINDSKSCQTSFAVETVERKLSPVESPKPNSGARQKLLPKVCRIPIPRRAMAKAATPQARRCDPMILKKISASDSKVPRPQKTPEFRARAPKANSSANRFKNIVSPIAKYIHDAPLPPLICNSRPLPKLAKERSTASNLMPAPAKVPRRCKRNCKSPASAGAISSYKVPARNKRGKENEIRLSAAEESIVNERFGMTMDEFDKLENKKLKKEIVTYVRQESDRLSKEGGDEQLRTLPYSAYKAPEALVTLQSQKQLDLVTKLHTLKNKKQALLASPKIPTILRHTGQRKVLHWADNLVAAMANVCSPNRPSQEFAPEMLASDDFKAETADASIVEIVPSNWSKAHQKK